MGIPILNLVIGDKTSERLTLLCNVHLSYAEIVNTIKGIIVLVDVAIVVCLSPSSCHYYSS